MHNKCMFYLPLDLTITISLGDKEYLAYCLTGPRQDTHNDI